MDRQSILKQLQQRPPRKALVIPEFTQGEEKAIFFASAITPNDELEVESILSGIEMTPGQRNTYHGVALLIHKLEFEDGSPVFERGDLNLMVQNVPSQLITRIYRKISLLPGHYGEEVQKAKKPSETTGEND